MFIISLSPKGTPEQLEPFRALHHAWAAKGFEEGLLLAGGVRVSPSGGMMFARNDGEAVEAFVAAEPFQGQGLAEIAVSELRIMSVATGLDALRMGQQD